MKRAMITLLAVLALSLCFTACKKPETPDTGDGPVKVNITFRQDGHDDIVKTVERGGALTDIPSPAQDKTGYTFAWDVTDFSAVGEDLTVTAVAHANTYTVTYDAGEGRVNNAVQSVVYDSTPTFEIPERDGYTFVGWTLDNKAVFGKWTIARDVTLVASWVKNNVNVYTVVFRQNGYADKVFENIEEGSAFTDIPHPINKTGYNVVWDQSKLTELNGITGNVIIEAVETAKTFTVTLNANGGTVSQSTVSVTFDEEYDLPVPTHEDSLFDGWTYDGHAVPRSGTWNIDGADIELTATWDESEWTERH